MSKPSMASRRTSAEWAVLVEACERSGLSRAAFAEREGVHPGTFSFWASRLAPKRSKRTKPAERGAASSFVPVRVRARVAGAERGVSGAGRVEMNKSAAVVVAHASSADSIEIALSNGRRVRCALSQVGDPRLAALLVLAEGGRGC